jgi:hypothetical protein
MKSTNSHWSEMLLRSGFFALVIAGVIGVYVGMVTFVAGVAMLLALRCIATIEKKRDRNSSDARRLTQRQPVMRFNRAALTSEAVPSILPESLGCHANGWPTLSQLPMISARGAALQDVNCFAWQSVDFDLKSFLSASRWCGCFIFKGQGRHNMFAERITQR